MADAAVHTSVWADAIIVDLRASYESSAREAAATARYGHSLRPEQPPAAIDEVTRLRALVSDRATAVGTSPPASVNTAVQSIVHSINDEAIDLATFVPVLTALAGKPELVRALADEAGFDRLAGLVEIEKRQRGLAALERYALAETSTAEEMFELIRRESWVFGGHLVLMPSAEVIPGLPPRSLPLIRFDTAIHVVMIESPCVADLVRSAPEGGWAISPEVYAAFDRARRVVGILHDHRTQIRQRWQFESSRAFVTILMGHPGHGKGAAPRWRIREEIRQLNTFSSGIAVVTYDELVHTARQLLPAPGPSESWPGG